MSKLVFVAVAATTFWGAAAAQAQVPSRSFDTAAQRYEALQTYEADASVARDDRSDMKVMGLSVPNGFRGPTAVTGPAY